MADTVHADAQGPNGGRHLFIPRAGCFLIILRYKVFITTWNAHLGILMTQIPTAPDLATPLDSMHRFIIAGWTGRDAASVQQHIDELKAIGVTPPSTVPVFYEVNPALLTTAADITVVGGKSSGEVEFVLLNTAQGLCVSVGSDHTDRWLETVSVHHSKQVCPKPIAPNAWTFASVEAHWDRLLLRSFSYRSGRRRLYQEGTVTKMLAPRDLLERFAQSQGEFAAGTAMSCGTLALHGDIEYGDCFELQLEDPVTRRVLSHRYRINALPIAA